MHGKALKNMFNYHLLSLTENIVFHCGSGARGGGARGGGARGGGSESGRGGADNRGGGYGYPRGFYKGRGRPW